MVFEPQAPAHRCGHGKDKLRDRRRHRHEPGDANSCEPEPAEHGPTASGTKQRLRRSVRFSAANHLHPHEIEDDRQRISGARKRPEKALKVARVAAIPTPFEEFFRSLLDFFHAGAPTLPAWATFGCSGSPIISRIRSAAQSPVRIAACRSTLRIWSGRNRGPVSPTSGRYARGRHPVTGWKARSLTVTSSSSCVYVAGRRPLTPARRIDNRPTAR